jgi:hypothetical protein
MSKTYVTFGSDHHHNINGLKVDKDCVVVVEGVDSSDARNNVFNVFGKYFSMEHPEDFFKPESMEYFPRGIFDLDGNQVPAPSLPKWKRYRFYTKSVDDPRPLKFNPKFPWWCSGYGGDANAEDGEYAVVVAYLPHNEPLFKYWNDAFEVDFTREDEITFSDRFSKPDYFEES